MSDATNTQSSESSPAGTRLDGLAGMDGTTGLWDELAALPVDQLVQRYRFSVGQFDSRLFEIGDELLDQAWLPESGVGRWPIRVLVGHLADAEVVFGHRMRRVVAEPGSVLTDWDEDTFIDGGLYGAGEGSPNRAAPPIGAFVATIYTMRQWLGEWLLSLTADCWERSCLHPSRGELTLHDLVLLATWHVEHHAGFLNLKIEKMLGPRPVAEACEPGGCGEGCACVPASEQGE